MLQNTQWRGDKATNEKLDAIADGLADTMESLAAVMKKMEIHEHEQRMLDQARELRETVGIQERISTSKPATTRHRRLPAGAQPGTPRPAR